MNKRFLFLVAVHAFFIKDSKVLLLERKDTGYMDGYWSVPAGHVDGGEQIAVAMKREIREETGIKIDAEIQPAHAMHRVISPEEERIDYFFVIKDWRGEVKNTEPAKCAKLSWQDLNDLPENIIPYVRFGLEEVLQQRQFSEFRDES